MLAPQLRHLAKSLIPVVLGAWVFAAAPALGEDALPAATILLKKLDMSASAAGAASASLRGAVDAG